MEVKGFVEVARMPMRCWLAIKLETRSNACLTATSCRAERLRDKLRRYALMTHQDGARVASKSLHRPMEDSGKVPLSA